MGWGWDGGADLHVHFCDDDDHGSPEFATQGAKVFLMMMMMMLMTMARDDGW